MLAARSILCSRIHRWLAQVPAEDIAQLRHLAPQLKAMCSTLADYRIPYTLGHGDLHPGNIAGNQEALRVL